MSIFRIGPYRLDTRRKIVSLKGRPLQVGTKAVEVLIALAQRAGEVVTKEELLAQVWPEGFIEEANLSQNVYVLRRALREHWDAPAIATIHGRGYRFVAKVERADAASVARRKPFAWSIAAISMAAVIVAAIASMLFLPHSQTQAPALSARGRQYFTVAQYYLNQRRLKQAASYFARMLQTDPRSSLGDAGLAEAYALMPDYGVAPASWSDHYAYLYAGRALKIDRKSAAAVAVMGFIKNQQSGDPTVGIGDFRRSISLDATDALPHEWLGESLFEIGQMALAEMQLETAQRLNPVSPVGQTWLGSVYLMQRRYTDAIDHLHRAVDLYPHDERALELLAIANTQVGDYVQARANLDAIAKFCACAERVAALRAFVFAHDKSTIAQARAELDKALHARHISDPLNIAFAYIALGDRDSALNWLHRAVLRDPREAALLAEDPRLDPVKGDWRFNLWTHPFPAAS